MNQTAFSPQAAAYILRTNRYMAACTFLSDFDEWFAQRHLQRVREIIQRCEDNPMQLRELHRQVNSWRDAARVYRQEAVRAAFRYEHEGNQLKDLEELEKFVELIRS